LIVMDAEQRLQLAEGACLKGHTGAIHHMCVTNGRLFTGGDDHHICAWSLDEGELVARSGAAQRGAGDRAARGSAVTSLSASHVADSEVDTTVLVGHADGVLRAWSREPEARAPDAAKARPKRLSFPWAGSARAPAPSTPTTLASLPCIGSSGETGHSGAVRALLFLLFHHDDECSFFFLLSVR
jgi:hypothetical protein